MTMSSRPSTGSRYECRHRRGRLSRNQRCIQCADHLRARFMHRRCHPRPVAKVGGLLHFMLPEAPPDAAEAGKSPYMFADSGIPMLFREAYEKGAQKRRLRVRVAGGAQIMDEKGVFNIGQRNCLAMRKIFWRAGVLVHAEETGGNCARTMR